MSTNVLTAKSGFSFGADPELFILNEKGVPVCADGLIPGTKENPYRVPYGAVQVDGMAAEFNIDPATSFEEFDHNIVQVMKTLKSMLPPGYSFSKDVTVEFSEEEWEKAPDHAKILGCTPDFNAWIGDMNPPPNADENTRLRSAGGHVHTGWTSGMDTTNMQHIEHGMEFVKELDWLLGAWSLRLDDNDVRRSLYGKAGAMRVKPYGVEYRVLSNFWIFNKPTRRQVWNRLQVAIANMRSGGLHVTQRNNNSAVITSINSSKLDPDFFHRFKTFLSKGNI